MAEKTVVVVSGTVESDYSFVLPFSCLLWRELVGFDVKVFLAGLDWSSHRATMCLHALSYFGITPHVVHIPGYALGTIAKHVRQHAACDTDITDDTWLMPTDADLWPLTHAFFHQHECGSEKAVLYNAFGDQWKSKAETLYGFAKGIRFPTIPMCHTVMRAKEWREAWKLEPNDIRTSLLRTFEREGVGVDSQVPLGESQEGWTWWVNSDQRVLTHRLCQQDWFPEKPLYPEPRRGDGVQLTSLRHDSQVLFIDRPGGPPQDRLDRAFPAMWPRHVFIPGRYVDAHLHKQPEAHWSTLLPIINALLPQHSAWAREFFQLYTRKA